MKKLFFVLVLSLTLLLSGCDNVPTDLDYMDFAENTKQTYAEVEEIEDERYIVYYYGERCGHCATVKQEILGFFYEFDGFPFYILETDGAPDVSSLDEFVGTPTVLMITNGVVSEAYVGSVEVRDFIDKYEHFGTSLFTFEYDMFKSQHLTSYDQALEIQSDAYILYYYLDDCPHCIRTKPDFLKWAWDRDINDVYFMNGAQVSDPDNIPTELIILNSGTPILVIMKNGEFANEYYSGTDQVVDYINELGKGQITTDNYTE